MGKEGDLWDDSALLKAFDDAVSKYKKMHNKGRRNGSVEGGEAMSGREENFPALVDGNNEVKRHAEAHDSNNVASNTTAEMGEPNKLSPIKDDNFVESGAPETHIDSSYRQHVQDALQGYSDTQGAEEYNKLLNKYYELEEQRQKILQQLNHLGNWNYHGSGSDAQWGTSTAQEHQVSAAHPSYPTVACSCCPYACQCLVAPCTSLPVSSFSRPCAATSAVDSNEKPFALEDGDLVKTAIGAAERALSSLKTKAPGTSDEQTTEGHLAQNTSSKTDLTTVLNAWYSAGFYTGKYISEQSIAKKRLG